MNRSLRGNHPRDWFPVGRHNHRRQRQTKVVHYPKTHHQGRPSRHHRCLDSPNGRGSNHPSHRGRHRAHSPALDCHRNHRRHYRATGSHPYRRHHSHQTSHRHPDQGNRADPVCSCRKSRGSHQPVAQARDCLRSRRYPSRAIECHLSGMRRPRPRLSSHHRDWNNHLRQHRDSRCGRL